jgi:SAM-dependent methyltransferase
MDLNKDFWENRYISLDTGWDAGEVTIPLKKYFETLNNKQIKVLIPGGGNGHEAIFLHKNGFSNVFLLDFAMTPLRRFKQHIPDFPEEHIIHEDFFEFEGQFDLIVEQTFFCALDPALRKSYFEKMKTLLKPDGKLLGLLFGVPMNQDQPPFGGNEMEYRNLIGDLFEIEKLEPCYNSIKPRAGKELFMILKR